MGVDLSVFSYEFDHIKGNTNLEDYISWNINNITVDTNLQNNLFEVNPALSNANIKEHQYSDGKLSKIIKKIEQGKENINTKRYTLNDDKMLILKPGKGKTELLVAPDALKIVLMEEVHKRHFVFDKIYEAMKTRIFWHGMYRDIRIYCANCVPCNTSKQHKNKIPIQKMVMGHEIGSVLHSDIVGKLPLTLRKNKFILTILDSTSRFLEAFPIRNVESRTLLNVFNKYFSYFGIPKELKMDNGPYFRGTVFKEYMRALNIELRFISMYRAQGNGLIEITNKTLKSSLTAMSESTLQWDVRMDFFKLQYNMAKNRATEFQRSSGQVTKRSKSQHQYYLFVLSFKGIC